MTAFCKLHMTCAPSLLASDSHAASLLLSPLASVWADTPSPLEDVRFTLAERLVHPRHDPHSRPDLSLLAGLVAGGARSSGDQIASIGAPMDVPSLPSLQSPQSCSGFDALWSGPLLYFFFTLVAGPRRSLSLKLSDKRVYEPQIRARLVPNLQSPQSCSGVDALWSGPYPLTGAPRS